MKYNWKLYHTAVKADQRINAFRWEPETGLTDYQLSCIRRKKALDAALHESNRSFVSPTA